MQDLKIIEEFFYRDKTESVAKKLLGKLLVRKEANRWQIGRIVETEAYLGAHDLACHGAWRPNSAKTLWGEPGRYYVYLIYGMYYMLNIVCEEKGKPAAVLIRAVEPLQNLNLKAGGPGRITKAYNIDKSFDGQPAYRGNLVIVDDADFEYELGSSKRIGVDYAGDWAKKPLRFFVKNSVFVSKLPVEKKNPSG